MLNNRSVPANAILPHVCYRDIAAAIEWLRRVFGFQENYRYGPPDAPQGAQMHLGDAWIMLNGQRKGRDVPAETGFETQSLTVFVEDVDGHYARAKAEGVTISEELNEVMYGERQYGAIDLDGHRWLFSKHVRDVAPEEWGACPAANTPVPK